MTLTTAEIVTWIGSFAWPFLRFSAMMLVAPFFGARTIPVRIRVLLAVFLALMIAPMVPRPDIELLSAAGFLLLLQQLLAGILLGVILQAVFATLAIAGQNVATSMGLGFASMVDPQNGVQVTLIGQFYMILATLIFLGMNGHLVMIELLARSFLVLPLSTQVIEVSALWEVVIWSGEMFSSGVLVSLPVVTGVLMVNLALGVVTRAAPQLNIFAVGFPITMLAGFILLLLVIPTLQPILLELFERSFQFMGGLVSN
ncbi:MAG: flagellar biosynthetic protein FliR [Halieaceae bacterium]